MREDPICKMHVEADEAVTIEHEGRVLFFCSEGCRDRFLRAKPGGPEECRRHELIFVGGGPAGLTAAVYAAILKVDAFLGNGSGKWGPGKWGQTYE